MKFTALAALLAAFAIAAPAAAQTFDRIVLPEDEPIFDEEISADTDVEPDLNTMTEEELIELGCETTYPTDSTSTITCLTPYPIGALRCVKRTRLHYEWHWFWGWQETGRDSHLIC